METWLIGLLSVLLLASVCRAAPVSGSLTVLVESPVSVNRGETATLPCWLSASQSAEDLEVRWYRGNFETPVLHYKSKIVEDGSQDPSYAGRVSLGLKDVWSGGLKAGDVSLKLERVTAEDAGEYTCYVSSLQGYDNSHVSLQVTETGRPPLLSAVWKEDNRVNVSCESEGWYPRPELRWSDNTKDLSPASLVYRNVSSRHFSVHSWVLVSGSSEVSCSVGLSNMVAKESRMRFVKPPEKESSFGGWIAFGILLMAAGVAVGAFFLKKKGRKKSTEPTEENEPLLLKGGEPTALSAASEYYENIQFENTNEYLKVKNTIVRDNIQKIFPDGERVTCLTAIRGTPGFSGGKHYWEVSLGPENVDPKKSWWIGVTTATKTPQESDFCPNTSNGFWFLSSSPDAGNTFQFNTKPEMYLSVQSRPRTVSVYLDYDSGEISFYNVEEKSLILSLKNRFTEEVFPFFNPGKGDRAAMTLLQREKKSGEEGTAADPAVNNVPESTALDPGGKLISAESTNAADS